MTGPLVERRIVVAGRVQGVGFRWFARETAQRLGVGGWVRNMPDGTVVAEVSGPPEAVERFSDRLRAGPPAADVFEVLVSERTDPTPLPMPFSVVR